MYNLLPAPFYQVNIRIRVNSINLSFFSTFRISFVSNLLQRIAREREGVYQLEAFSMTVSQSDLAASQLWRCCSSSCQFVVVSQPGTKQHHEHTQNSICQPYFIVQWSSLFISYILRPSSSDGLKNGYEILLVKMVYRQLK